MSDKVYLTIGSCTKGEELYIKPFIQYHRFLGVEKFIFYDRTFEPINTLLKDEPDCEVIHWPEGLNTVHALAWASLIDRCKGKTKWLACIDLDQAIVPQNGLSIPNILKEYEQFASLQCNWKSFGSGGLMEYAPEAIFERFLMRCKDDNGLNNHTQFICQPDRAMAVRTDDPHHCKLPHNEVSVNTNKQIVNGPFNIPPIHDKMWIAHYISKSYGEAKTKWNKGRADIFGQKMPSDMWRKHEEFCNDEKETRVLEIWEMVKESLAGRP